ncbi:MAG: 4-diphosphocytidyl-2C-methyl-D-erythritol kinase, partial [Rhodospirillaceae bacterium]|nr:4-diphosphocytidyl-2C-methyl-D-erythritol kinase [Rhodospirillaceae bacterium]
MKFGKTPLKEAQGAILAHSMRFGDLALAKGRKLNRADINALRAAGIDEVTAARLGINDVGEDAAAKRIAAACAGKHISRDRAETGRVNLNAGKRGVLIYDRACLDRLNRVHEAVTCAGLGPGVLVEAGRMVATVK